MRYIHSLIVAVVAMSLAGTAAYAADMVRVVTKDNAVRQECRFFAPVAAKVKYGDALEVISEEGDWLHVKFGEVEGCIHRSAITEKKFKMTKKSGSAGEGASSGASTEEVALAGKGFNPSVEQKYRSDNPDMNFNAVDSIEGTTVSDEDLMEFIVEGGLRQPE